MKKAYMRIQQAGYILMSTLLIVGGSPAADWPQFLGPNRDGASADSEQMIKGFAFSGVKFRWKHPVGTGFAGPVVAGNRVILFHRINDQASWSVWMPLQELKNGATPTPMPSKTASDSTTVRAPARQWRRAK
ncbi:hypothetical protein [Verrucomicrobium spinosum]|uniref:hypothetical protein n=1 Tax=Verrucomicrobium spinosum TaxID=2736 RepID=UPI00210B2FD9|nr:hypothetical protein [Verrucomicrobium spinosum]